MKEYKSVSISTGAFNFCRYGVAIMLWVSILFRLKWLAVLVFAILVLSAILRVSKAPMIVIYNVTFGKFIKTKTEILDEKGMRFAHTMGAGMMFIGLVPLYFLNEQVGWWILFVVASLKTISALGFCPAYKLYGCMSSGGCCALTGKK